jgi:hypothetical protein
MIFLPGIPAPLSSHADGMRAVFGKLRAINDEHPLLVPERLCDLPLMLGQDGLIVPLALTHKLLHGAHLALGVWPRSQQAQGHGFDILARHVGREQAAQIKRRPLALLTALEERCEVLMVGEEFLSQGADFRGCERTHGRQAMRRRQVGDHINQSRHGGTPPGIPFPSVYPKVSL